MNYKIVVAETHRELSSRVNEEIAKGMIPVGGVTVSPDAPSSFPIWTQAVVDPAALVNAKLIDSVRRALKAK